MECAAIYVCGGGCFCHILTGMSIYGCWLELLAIIFITLDKLEFLLYCSHDNMVSYKLLPWDYYSTHYWFYISLLLAVVTCPELPPTGLNMKLVVTSQEFGGKLEYRCEEGYRLSGGQTSSLCQQDGTWSMLHRQPVCAGTTQSSVTICKTVSENICDLFLKCKVIISLQLMTIWKWLECSYVRILLL